MDSFFQSLINLFHNTLPSIGVFTNNIFNNLSFSEFAINDAIRSLFAIAIIAALAFLVFRLFVLAFKIGILASILYFLFLNITPEVQNNQTLSSLSQSGNQQTIQVVPQNSNINLQSNSQSNVSQSNVQLSSNLPPARKPILKQVKNTTGSINDKISNIVGKSSEKFYTGMDFLNDSYDDALDIFHEYDIDISSLKPKRS